MIRWPLVLRILGLLVAGLAGCLIIPLTIAVYTGDDGRIPLLAGVASSSMAGLIAAFVFRRHNEELTRREALMVVASAWLVIGLFGALPFYLSPHFPTYTDAVFECVSGFTTTGASILPQVEVLPDSLQFWRGFTHWLGGLGVILLMIAILPLVGAGGVSLYRAEFSGAKSDRLKPRIAQTAAALWKVYAGFTIVGYIALRALGMGPLDACFHSFAAIGTGGFSTRNANVESFNSAPIELVLLVLMVLGGINFARHYEMFVLGKPRLFFGDTEIQYYLAFLTLSVLFVTTDLYHSGVAGWVHSLRLAAFQVVSIMTATGFSSANFDSWPAGGRVLLLALMFIGGCTGSTAGGLKVTRIYLIFRVIKAQFRSLADRHRVTSVRFNQRALERQALYSMVNIVYLAILLHIVASLALAATGLDIVTSFSAVTACMFNVGPGLGAVGPAANYAHLTILAKWVLVFIMLAGRLEFYGFLVIFTGVFWKD